MVLAISAQCLLHAIVPLGIADSVQHRPDFKQRRMPALSISATFEIPSYRLDLIYRPTSRGEHFVQRLFLVRRNVPSTR